MIFLLLAVTIIPIGIIVLTFFEDSENIVLAIIISTMIALHVIIT